MLILHNKDIILNFTFKFDFIIKIFKYKLHHFKINFNQNLFYKINFIQN